VSCSGQGSSSSLSLSLSASVISLWRSTFTSRCNLDTSTPLSCATREWQSNPQIYLTGQIQGGNFQIRLPVLAPVPFLQGRPVFWSLCPAFWPVVLFSVLLRAGCTQYSLELKCVVFCTFARANFLAESTPESRHLHLKFQVFFQGWYPWTGPTLREVATPTHTNPQPGRLDLACGQVPPVLGQKLWCGGMSRFLTTWGGNPISRQH